MELCDTESSLEIIKMAISGEEMSPTSKKRPNLAEQLWKVMIFIFVKFVKNEANKSFSAPKILLGCSWVILEQE